MDAQQVRRPVVVGVDGSQSAMAAVRWGVAEAARLRSPLRLILAFAWMVDDVAARPGLEERYRAVLLDRAHDHLVAAAAVAGREEPGVDVEQQLIEGHPIPVLDAESESAQLIVVGDTGLGRVEGALIGSVAVALAAHASCPVVVVRGTGGDRSSALPVLVGVHGAPTSESAIAFAFEAAAARNAPLLAVHTWWDLVIDLGMGHLPDWDAVEADEQRLLSQRLAGWSEKYPGVPVEGLVTRDRPSHSLLQQAARAQLVVVGSRRRGRFAGSVLGSVGNALLHRAPCPVAVVRLDADVLA
jgi:nucleotide-binding universal stress UspA family protein